MTLCGEIYTSFSSLKPSWHVPGLEKAGLVLPKLQGAHRKSQIG